MICESSGTMKDYLIIKIHETGMGICKNIGVAFKNPVFLFHVL